MFNSHGTESGFCPNYSIFPCRYYSTVTFLAHISSWGWTIGPLVAIVQRQSNLNKMTREEDILLFILRQIKIKNMNDE
jgi:hypothetical protein